MSAKEAFIILKELAEDIHKTRLPLDFAAAKTTTNRENSLLDLRKASGEAMTVMPMNVSLDEKYAAINHLEGAFMAANLHGIFNEKDLSGHLRTLKTVRNALGEE